MPDVVALRGAHQIENARLATGAMLLLQEQGLPVPSDAYGAGLGSVRWPGRFEVVAGEPAIVIDGAMNGASAARLRENLALLPHERVVAHLPDPRRIARDPRPALVRAGG